MKYPYNVNKVDIIGRRNSRSFLSVNNFASLLPQLKEELIRNYNEK